MAKGVKFIRVNGRIVPIKDKGQKGKGAGSRAPKIKTKAQLLADADRHEANYNKIAKRQKTRFTALAGGGALAGALLGRGGGRVVLAAAGSLVGTGANMAYKAISGEKKKKDRAFWAEADSFTDHINYSDYKDRKLGYPKVKKALAAARKRKSTGVG